MTGTNVSLVTVTYNNAAELSHFWQGWPEGAAEWVVVDNASTDGSACVARALGAVVVQRSTNAGFSTANNQGAALATGRVLGFVNPDLTVTREGITALAHRVTAEKALVAPQLVNPDGSLQENGRNTPYPVRKLAHMFAPGSGPNRRYIRPVDQGVERVVWAMGAAIFMSDEVFHRLGGWDPDYFMYYEDSDLCLRALDQNIPTLVDGDVRWVHGWARATKSGRSLAVWRHEVRSAARFYSRHPGCIVSRGARSATLREAEATSRA